MRSRRSEQPARGGRGEPLLDLDPAPTPEVGRGAIALAERLEEEGASVSADRAALRRLAAVLLRTGELAGDAGGVRVVLGRRLGRGMDELDGLLARGALGDEERAALERAPDEVADLDDAGVDRVLQRALGPLTDRAGVPPSGAGWVAREPARAAPDAAVLTDALISRSAATEVERACLDVAAARLSEDLGRGSRHREAARALRRLEGALALLDAPRWLGDGAAGAARESVVRLACALADRDGRAQATAGLARLAALAGIVSLASALPQGNASREVRERISGLVVRSARDEDPARWRPMLRTMERALRIVDAADRFDDDGRIVRQLRPAWRERRIAALHARHRLVETLAGVPAMEDPTTHPGVLGALRTARLVMESARDLRTVSDWLSGWAEDDGRRPRAAADLDRVADRVLVLLRSLGDPSTAARGAAALARLAGEVRRFAEMPGERALRAAAEGRAPEPWRTLGGRRAAELPGAIDAAREAWAGELPGPSAAYDGASARLDVLRGLMDRMNEHGATLAGGATAAPLGSRWPGWGLDTATLDGLRGGETEGLSRVVVLVLEGRYAAARERLDALAASHAVVRLAGVLELGLGERVSAASGSVLHDVAQGPPDEAEDWLAVERGALVSVVRCAEEGAAGGGGEAWRRAAHAHAQRVLLRL